RHETCIDNGTVCDGIAEPLDLGERGDFPFTLQWPRESDLQKRVQRGPRRVDSRRTVIVIHDGRAFPSQSESGGPGAARFRKRDCDGGAYLITVVVARNLVQNVQLTGNPGEFEGPFGASQVG